MIDKLTIVIPCKNEQNYIGKLLDNLSNQQYINGVRILIADAGSSDNTIDIINNYRDILNIEIIEGGLPAVGRNNGLFLSNTKWTLFIDADAEIKDNFLIKKSLDKIESKDYELIACKLKSNIFSVRILYRLTNLIIGLSKFDKPFAVGIFMMVNTEKAKLLGGFPEWAMHCEDYLLSSNFKNSKFTILDGYVYSDDRRFKKMTYWQMIKYFIKNIKMRNNRDYFKKDVNYWT
jgi:glycosyltransferase involved in cell wall biosynthesis